MPEIESVILAGGESKRFGQDKATLKFGNMTLVERIYRELNSVMTRVWIIGLKQKIPNLPAEIFIEDRITNTGPIGGLFTALAQSDNPLLVTSCDMPFINREHIKFLTTQFDPHLPATIAISKKGFEPLFGIYQHQAFAIIEKMIASKEFAMHRIFDHMEVKFVDFCKAGYISDLFFNINTFSDYKKALYLGKDFESKNRIKDAGGKNGNVC